MIFLLTRHDRRVIQSIKNQRSAEDAAHDFRELRIKVKEQISSADIALIFACADHFLGLVLRSRGRQRIESSSARVRIFEQSDRRLCRIFIFDSNILNIRAERSFNCRNIFFGYADQFRQRSEYLTAANFAVFIRLHHIADAGRVPLEQFFHAAQCFHAVYVAVIAQFFVRKIILRLIAHQFGIFQRGV